MTSQPVDRPEGSGEQGIAERMGELQLYHTFEFPDGTVIPGFFDLRKAVRKLPIPDDLTGKRCLDVASATGFFAIEMAKHGGDVMSVDMDDPTRLDWQGPPGLNEFRSSGGGLLTEGFELACKAFGVTVERRLMSLYDLSPDEVGTFDYVFMGNILMHLSDPGRGLHAVRSVVGPGGEFVSFEGVSLSLSVMRPFTATAKLWHLDEPTWWRHNIRGHRRLVEAGGFEILGHGGPIFVPLGKVHPRLPHHLPRRLHEWNYWLVTRQIGTASQWVRARPRPLPGAFEPDAAA